MRFFYNIFVHLYPTVAILISKNNKKANQWVKGRKNIFEQLAQAFENNSSPIIWIHCSSLGEFEQGRPIIEEIRRTKFNAKILLTFFSPSGYEIRKDYKDADWVFYLPMDSPKNAKQFLNIVKPSLVLFVKYEFWFYYLQEAKNRNIPLLLVSGIFRNDQPFFKWYGSFYKSMLHCFTHFFVQDQKSAELLYSIGFNKNITIGGDTRFDRVVTIANEFSAINLIEKFVGNSKVIVAGSTWLEDDEELDHFANTNQEIKFIIAPHDIQKSRIDECLSLYKNAVLFSSLANNAVDNKANVLIIDNMGMLSKLYHYATICYVGGGFGNDGVHNVLEAAVYNKPVVIGPEYEKYIEAIELVETGGSFSIENALELEKVFNDLLHNQNAYKIACTNAGNYVKSKTGATNKIMGYIQEKRLFTN